MITFVLEFHVVVQETQKEVSELHDAGIMKR